MLNRQDGANISMAADSGGFGGSLAYAPDDSPSNAISPRLAAAAVLNDCLQQSVEEGSVFGPVGQHPYSVLQAGRAGCAQLAPHHHPQAGG